MWMCAWVRSRGDPKFCITDILPHLALEQYTRKINELIKGEELNIVIGSRPFKDDKASEKVEAQYPQFAI